MRDRITNLLKGVDEGSAVFISGRANIFYYSGFTSEDAYLIISGDRRVIVTDSRYFVQAKEQSPDFELADVQKGWKDIFALFPNDTVCFEENNITFGEYSKITSQTDKRFKPMQKNIDFPRRFKSEGEIELIARAEKIGDDAFSYVLERLHVGMTEREAALMLETRMRSLGAEGLSFDTISASGVRSCMPHGTATDKVIEKGDFLTLDFGCVYNGYCSDMTRTVVFGNPTDEQREIYGVVLAAQERAIENLHVGIKCSDADKIARDIISNAGYGDKFTHTLGHSVGIEIHETPVFSPKSTDILQNGNVLSVEPGIYIDGVQGVRIEDLIAVKNGEIINLSGSPKELIII